MNRSHTLRAGLLGLGLAALTALPARAQEVNFAGSTLGGFNATAPAATSSLFGLTYQNSTFNATTSNGFVGIGNEPLSGPGGTNFNNLGSFALATTAQNYTGSNTFTLLVTFTAPAGITGGQTATFTAQVTGSVSANNQGGVLVDFVNSPQTFTWSGGTFTFAVNDVSVNAGKIVGVTGQITASVVPEPASMTLLATGLAGLGAAARRRKNKK